MMAQMPEDVSIPLLDNSDEFISALSEFKTCNDDTRLRELFELLINTDLDQVAGCSPHSPDGYDCL